MRERVSTYKGKSVEITYDRDLCIHAAECGRGSKALFDASKDPWCDPDAVEAQRAVDVVGRCPTGALKARVIDGTVAPSAREQTNIVAVQADGPLFVSGDLAIQDEPVEAGRVALCRCGASSNKPYCDGSHVRAGFKDPGPVASDPADDELSVGRLNVKLAPDGPLMLNGPLTLRAASGRDAVRAGRAVLCRCGASKNKPFCDGSHSEVGFKSD